MLPTDHFTYTDHQQSPRSQAICQAIEDFSATPAAEIDQQVLTENNVHAGNGRVRQLQHIEPRKAHTCCQAGYHLKTIIGQRQKIPLSQPRLDLFHLARAVYRSSKLCQLAHAYLPTRVPIFPVRLSSRPPLPCS